MRYNDTNNHQIHPGGGSGIVYVRAANVTSSAATIRIFNVPDLGKETFSANDSPDQDNAIEYGYSVAANKSRMFPCDARYPIIVYNGTANSVNWSMIR